MRLKNKKQLKNHKAHLFHSNPITDFKLNENNELINWKCLIKAIIYTEY